MIVRESITVKLSGRVFSPAVAGRRTGLPFVDAVEPGDLDRRGEPSPVGYANLGPADDVPADGKLAATLERFLRHADALRSLGVEDVVVYAGYFYRDQCNLTFSPEATERLARAGATFWVSCYDETAGS